MKNTKGAALNKVRIIGGSWRSRMLTFPSVPHLRPTPDRVRETLFNWLGQQLFGKTCLDLFAGSGVLGFEASSRGADQVVCVENNKQAYSALCTNSKLLAANNLEVVCADALKFLKQDVRRFDIIFLDPPFGQDLFVELWPLLPDHLNAGAVVYAESEIALQAPSGWQTHREGQAGQVYYQLLTWNPDA